MKKMIISDLLQARSTLFVQFLICTFLGCLFGIIMESTVLAVTMPITVFAFGHCIGMPLWDENHNWQLMRFAMPYGRREIVMGRFATAIIFMLIGLAFSLVAALIVSVAAMVGPVTIEVINPLETFCAIAAVVGCLLLMCSVMFTVGFAFGFQKAGKWIPVIMAIGIGILAALGGEFIHFPGVMETLESLPIVAVVGGLVAVAVVIYIAAMLLSIRLYERRSF